MTDTEADICRKFVVPKLQSAGWEAPPHAINEQRTFTDGRIVFVGGKARRGKRKRADYILRYRSDFPIAVVEAKARYRHAAEGLQQAREYAEILGLTFAYATNGMEIIEVDYSTGVERPVQDVETRSPVILTRILLNLCTGAGKTAVAFQIAWKLWSARWNTKGTARKPKILFLADRNLPSVDDRRRRSDLQEHRAGPGRGLDAGVQTDHRAGHAAADRLRQP